MDVTTAFLNATLDEEIYMQQPEGYEISKGSDLVCKLNKSLYGLKQASLAWNQRVDKVLRNLGFIRNRAENCLYFKKDDHSMLIVALYVDDILIAGTTDESVTILKKNLLKEFKMKDLGKVSKFLGLNIKQSDDFKIELTLRDYIETMVKEYNMKECKPERTPSMVSQDLTLDEKNHKLLTDLSNYRSLVGKLLFAANTVRFDISHIVGVLSRYLKEPKELHWKAAKRVLRYLKDTEDFLELPTNMRKDQKLKDIVILIGPMTNYQESQPLVWCSCMPIGAITWRSKKQATIALSTTEAEFMSLCDGAKEAEWLKQVFKDFQLDMTSIKLYKDNQSAIKNGNTSQCITIELNTLM